MSSFKNHKLLLCIIGLFVALAAGYNSTRPPREASALVQTLSTASAATGPYTIRLPGQDTKRSPISTGHVGINPDGPDFFVAGQVISLADLTQDKLTWAAAISEIDVHENHRTGLQSILSFERPLPDEPSQILIAEVAEARPLGLANDSELLDDQRIFLPVIGTAPDPPPGINTQDKEIVRNFYLQEYLSSEGISADWTGNLKGCDPGETSVEFRSAIIRRINYYRSMSGISPLAGFNDEYNRKSQAAALMMSANRQLSHMPPESWKCYSADGYEGAGNSNLSWGSFGPSAIDAYISDRGDNNYSVGHRRWILFPKSQYFGTGDIPPQNGNPPANALWVFDDGIDWSKPAQTREPFVAWPPPGYVPRQVVYPRWSIAYGIADFTAATVTMTRDGTPINVTISPFIEGSGQNTLVWELDHTVPDYDVTYNITIDNVVTYSPVHSFTYRVNVFDPTD